ncbi:MAG: 1-(5-phosphoribosyl)-5-[(5-phosphoribosylamino)methylideneamino] imidazole-4-carboxamide isomerase [Desulfobacterota bacterium]|nr:1-(5-phosphoribosyl)-5-[(5-phosphoribosylamino)methylideneamino] imidazole-4-carboxamide isomerase [Thermodesulfobacteriota bacterium]MDW8001743.1 1-(5-phosphoribosyl)-5-[(5-phosphoribosylamino)methylideneamino] imidazole-4-carboxamide isomerase [Deltaproteobacteria bacterium]
MRVLFAMDLLDGKCVRLTRGDYSQAKVYGEDPILMIEQMVNKGARDFHIVDLNGAKEGRPRHLEIIKAIRERVPGYMEVGGGVRTKEIVEIYKDLGVDGVVIGTKALIDPEFLPSVKGIGDITLSLDILNGKPMIMGWKKESGKDLEEIIKFAEECEVNYLLVTAIERDGTLSGPDFEVLSRVIGSTRIPVIGSGGVRTLEDVKLLLDMGAYGVVVGKAIYEGKIRIEEVTRFFSEN